jgi:hypothetical protein
MRHLNIQVDQLYLDILADRQARTGETGGQIGRQTPITLTIRHTDRKSQSGIQIGRQAPFKGVKIRLTN